MRTSCHLVPIRCYLVHMTCFLLHVPLCLLFSSLISGSAFSDYVVFTEIIINCAKTFKSMPVPNLSTPQLPTAMMSQESSDSSNLTQTELSF